MSETMEQRIWAALDATWAPLAITSDGGFLIREGAGGGKRVSAASIENQVIADRHAAENAMDRLGQTPLFQLRPRETALDMALETDGYQRIDPVTVLSVDPATLDHEMPRLRILDGSEPLARQAEIWDAGGVGPARLEVMARVTCSKSYLLAREGDRPAGTAFVAVSDGIAMIHAIEVLEAFRRKGVGRDLVRGAARWAHQQGATHLMALVVEDNLPSRDLHHRLGFCPATNYHYRIRSQPDRSARS